MKGKVNCTCGWSWNKSDSSVKDMYICHQCGRDNSNNMKNGGWLDSYADGGTMQEHQENYNDYKVSAPEGFKGTEYSNVGRNYSPAWGGQFQNGGKAPLYVESKNDPRYRAYQDSLSLFKENKHQQFTEDNFPEMKNKVTQARIPYNSLQELPKVKGKRVGFERKDNTTDEINKKSVIYSEKIKPEYFNLNKFINWDDEYQLTGYYKKPQQEVIVKKQEKRKSIQAIQNNLQPPGIQNDFNIEADIPQIRQQVRQPKYYDVEDYTQGSANYIGNQTNYRTSDLSTLSEQSPNNTRKITPRYAMGGDVYPVNYVPQAQEGRELTFLQPTSNKLPEGYMKGSSIPSTERAMSIGGENGEPAYLIPSFKYGQELLGPVFDPISEFRRTGEHLGGPFKTWQEADEWENTVRHPAVENRETIMFPQEKFAMGGSIPGAVGFTYARTKGIPSNGPYAKKTMASAQNGQEMQYYREGLDWKPKGMKDGGWLDGYDKAQVGTEIKPKLGAGKYYTTTGKVVDWGTPDYERAYNRGEVVTEDGGRSEVTLDGGRLDEVVIKNNYKNGFWENYRDKIIEEGKDSGVLGAIMGVPINAITSLPQLAMMNALTGEMQRPSEAIGFDNDEGAFANPISFGKHASNFLLDAVTDPANLIGAGVLTKENALSKLGKISTSIAPELRQRLQTAGSSFNSSELFDGNNIIKTPEGFENRVFDSNMQLGQYKGVGHLSEPGYNYRVLSSEEIEAIRKSKGVFPREGKQKGGNKNVKYWTKGNEKNWFGDQPTETIRVSETNFNPDKVVNSKHVEVYDKQTGKFKPLKHGGIIKDDMGYWNPENWNSPVEIGSNNITMQDIPFDVLGISDTGDTKLMKPGKNYKFKGKKVTEFRMAKNGLRQEQKGLVNLDQLTNFTNYNTKQPGGWLDTL